MIAWGVSTQAETEMLMEYASKANIGIVEIGIFEGGNTANMASVAHVPIYGIDPFVPDSMPPFILGSKEATIRNMSFYKRFTLFEDYSYNIVKNWSFPFDFIFIDGSHFYEDVKKDFEDWFPLLSVGGICAIHDAGAVTTIVPCPFYGWEGPIKLIKELLNRYEYIDGIDSLRVFKK